MSKIMLMRAKLAEGLLFWRGKRVESVAVGDNLAIEDGVLNASGGGGGSDLDALSDVNMGATFALQPSDMLLYLGETPGVQWQNVPSASVIDGGVQVWLASIPGYGASKVLATNAANDGFEWVTP